MKKILYVITKANFGGAQRYVLELAEGAKNAGFEVAVAYGEKGVLVEKLAAAKIPSHPLSGLKRDINPGNEMLSFFSLISLFNRVRPDIVHLNSSKVGGLGALAARIAGVPRIIFTVHGFAFNEDRPFLVKLFFLFSQWLTVLLCHTTIVVAEHDKKQTHHWLFIANKVVLIRNGIGAITFLAKDEARDALTKRANGLEKYRESLWIGANSELTHNKGLDYLLESFVKVRAYREDAVLVLISSGEDREKLQNMAHGKGISASVFFLGYVENAREYLKAFDIFTMPSRKEGLPYAILEAGAAGLPIVASHVGGIPEIIDDTKSGYLTAPGDTVLLTARLKELCGSVDLRTKLGSELKGKIEKDFSLEKMLLRTLALYS